MKNFTYCLIALCAFSSGADADILRVGGVNGTYAQIADAVAAAQDGDTIVVGAGNYTGFTVDAKSLTFVSELDDSRIRCGSVAITNTGPTQPVVLKLTADWHWWFYSLAITNCSGAVRVENGFFRGRSNSSALDNVITSSPNVVIDGGLYYGEDAALQIIDSQVAIYNGRYLASDGVYLFAGGTDGGDGLQRTGVGKVFMSATTATGGAGGQGGWLAGGGPGGGGGNGVTSLGLSNVLCLGCELTGGAAGAPVSFAGPGADLAIGIEVPGIPRLITATPIVFDTSQIELTFQGDVGEQVSYAISQEQHLVFGPEIGPLLVPSPQWISAGTIPASGTLHVIHAVPDLPQLERATLFFQGLMTGSANDYLTNASQTIILDRGLDDCTLLNTPLGKDQCSPNTPNSTGQSGRLGAMGSHCVSNNQVILTASMLPPNEFGYMLNSTGLDMIVNPGSALGTLCLGGGHPLGRHNSAADIRFTGADGDFELVVDMTSVPSPTGPVTAVAGQGWAFQAWHRDGSTSHFTNAIAIPFH